MSEVFKAHTNFLAVFSDKQETHMLFCLKRPSFNDDGKLVHVVEEQALISMSFEYAKQVRDALERNIKQHEDNLAKEVSDGDDIDE